MSAVGGATDELGRRIVVEVGRVVLRGVPAERAGMAVAAFERALRDHAAAPPVAGDDARGGDAGHAHEGLAVGSPAGTDPAVEIGQFAARDLWQRIAVVR